ncbi:MAG: hypothetical protein JNM66_24145 [Bryobacterales bacterium]|nr:hypothetical protein [Bryobacterales bacterium]
MSQVNWGKKPAEKRVAAPAADLDSLVKGQKSVQTRRLNLNIPASLHTRIKAQCAMEGRDMTETLIEILEARYPERI